MSVYTVHVSGLPETTNETSILEFFSRVGTVTQCEQRGSTAIVTFENLEDFTEALHMHDMEFEDGVRIQVKDAAGSDEKSPDRNNNSNNNNDNDDGNGNEDEEDNNNNDAAEEPSDSAAAAAANSRNDRQRFQEEFKIAVRQLPAGTTEQQLRELFEPLGAVQDLYLHPTRRYAFVGFDNIDSVEAALQMSGRELNGGVLEVEKKRAAGRREPKSNNSNNNNNNNSSNNNNSNGRNISDDAKIVVKNIPSNTSEDALRSFFASAGDIVDIFIHHNKSFAFIGFSTGSAADAALRMDNAELDGSRLRVERRQRQRCFKCNKEGHMAMHCRATELVCRSCGRPGHLARECRAHGQSHPHGQSARADKTRRDDRRDDRREERRHERRRQRSRSESNERRRRRSRSPKRSSRYERSRSRSPARRR